jgi:anti-sigma factor RsiW
MPGGMNTNHLDAEALERYALGQLEEPEHAATEEHLLICEECRNRLIEAERYVRAMREALRRPAE